MKIKKHGKMFNKEEPIHTEKFKCNNCNCEFTCKDDEYYVHLGGADWTCGSGGITTTTYTISSTINDILVCSCPECYKIVKKIRTRNNNWYTTTTTTPLSTFTTDKFIDKDKITITCNSTNEELT